MWMEKWNVRKSACACAWKPTSSFNLFSLLFLKHLSVFRYGEWKSNKLLLRQNCFTARFSAFSRRVFFYWREFSAFNIDLRFCEMILCEKKWNGYKNDSKNNKMKNEFIVGWRNFRLCDDIKTKSLFGDECKEIQNRAGDSFLSTVVTCGFCRFCDVFEALERRLNKQKLPATNILFTFLMIFH